MSTHDSPQQMIIRFSAAELLWWIGGIATLVTFLTLLDSGQQLPAALVLGTYLSIGLLCAIRALMRLRREQDERATPTPPPDWTDAQLAQLHADGPTGPIPAVVEVDLDGNRAVVRPVPRSIHPWVDLIERFEELELDLHAAFDELDRELADRSERAASRLRTFAHVGVQEHWKFNDGKELAL